MLAFMKKMEILKPVPFKYNKVKVGDKYEYYADGFTSINTESHRGWQKSANK